MMAFLNILGISLLAPAFFGIFGVAPCPGAPYRHDFPFGFGCLAVGVALIWFANA